MKYTECLQSYLASSPETWTSFAQRAGVSRAALYKSLKGRLSPRMDTAEKLLNAAGFTLEAVPKADCPNPAPKKKKRHD